MDLMLQLQTKAFRKDLQMTHNSAMALPFNTDLNEKNILKRRVPSQLLGSPRTFVRSVIVVSVLALG